MRLLSILTLTTLLSAPAFAADLGTYRPGSPYHSVVAPGADVCQSQCSGDAQCKGWNYVKVNPRAAGVCEFNTKAVSPIESAISISGAGGTSAASGLIQGDTNTVRVGTQVPPKARPNTVTVGRPSGRRVVRKAVPQRVQPAKTVARRPVAGGNLTAQQNEYRTASGHAAPQGYQRQTIQSQARQQQIGEQQVRQEQIRQQQARQQQIRAQRQAALSKVRKSQLGQQQIAPQGQRLIRDPRIQAPQQQAPNQQGPRFQHNLDGAPRAPQNLYARPNQQQQQPQGRKAPQKQTHAPQGRPPIGVPIQGQGSQAAARRTAPIPQQSVMPKGSVNDPVTHQNGARRVQAAAQRQAQLSYEQAEQSLYGSLNDDVQAPRPLTAPPADPNAPIPTSQARPTQPVSQQSLDSLAGGYR